VPDSVARSLRLPEGEAEERLRSELALALYAQEILPFGKAAQLADVSRYVFADMTTRRGIPRHYGKEELAEDLAYADPLSDLDAAYAIEDRPAVASFIRQNGLREVLLQAREPLDVAFGRESRKVLRLVCDGDGTESLFCLVMWHGEMGQARHALQSFDSDWWLGQGLAATGLNFDFELI
jgi:predicted HTH domain antitoxin